MYFPLRSCAFLGFGALVSRGLSFGLVATYVERGQLRIPELWMGDLYLDVSRLFSRKLCLGDYWHYYSDFFANWPCKLLIPIYSYLHSCWATFTTRAKPAPFRLLLVPCALSHGTNAVGIVHVGLEGVAPGFAWVLFVLGIKSSCQKPCVDGVKVKAP